MTSIRRANIEDDQVLAEIGRISFFESHGHSASKEDIDNYANEKYTDEAFRKELSDQKNIYHLICQNQQPAGYSKIIFNCPAPPIEIENVTKLERIYLLKEFYHLKLGYELLQFNIDLSKKNNQEGMWLYVWKENPRAINFYTKAGFQIIGSHDFRISETHTNPNHQMYLKF